MRSLPSRVLLAVLAVVLCTVACTGDDSESAAAVERWPGDGGQTRLVELSYGYEMDVPADWTVSFGGLHRSQNRLTGEFCEDLAANVGPVEVYVVGRGCTAGHSAGNGDSGSYLSPDQADGARSIATHDLANGDLVTFVQPHYVCTNECEDETETVALFTADDPADPDFPVLMFVRWTDELPVEQLVALGESVRIDADWESPSIERLEIVDGIGILQPRGATVFTTGVSRARINDAAGDECEVREARVAWAAGFDLIGRECTGRHGIDDFDIAAFLTVDQVQGAVDPEHVEVPAGTVTVFEIAGCDDCTMGLLPVPVDASERYGALQFFGDRTSIRALAEVVVFDG